MSGHPPQTRKETSSWLLAHGSWQMNKSNKEIAVWSMHEMPILPFPSLSFVVIAMSYQL